MACLFPFFVDDTPVPCGRCPECLKRRVDGWAFRLYHQELVSDFSSWIRLSYDNDHLVGTPNGFVTLCKRDVQLYFKRLRKTQHSFERRNGLPHLKIKYLLCGEYGSKRGRPHYHVVLFNVRPTLIESAWHDDEGVLIGEVWIDPRPLSYGAVGYTIGYCFNKTFRSYGAKDDRIPEFLLMSKGLGRNYLTPAIIAYHRADILRMYGTLPGGKRVALPRYFVDRIYSESDKLLRLDALDEAIRKKHKVAYDSHVLKFGDASDFIRSQGEARRASVVNFKFKHSIRKDL